MQLNAGDKRGASRIDRALNPRHTVISLYGCVRIEGRGVLRGAGLGELERQRRLAQRGVGSP